MCQKNEQGGRGQIKRRARGRCRSQRADPAARDGPDPATGSGSCQTKKPDRGAAGLSGEAGVGPGVRWRDHCSNKDPLEDGGAGLFGGARVGPGGRWRDHCSNEGFTLLLGSFCLHRKNYSPHPPSFWSFQLLSAPPRKKIRLPPSSFVARLPPLPKVSHLLFGALHLPPSSEVPCLLFVTLRHSVGLNRETKGDGEEPGNFQRGREANGERRRRRATKGGEDSPDTKGELLLPAGAGEGEGKEGFGRCEGEGQRGAQSKRKGEGVV